MRTSEAVAVTRMLDDAGYPREPSSPYPDSPTGRPPWSPETARPLLEAVNQVATASMVSGDVERFRAPTARFAETVIEVLRWRLMTSIGQRARRSPQG